MSAYIVADETINRVVEFLWMKSLGSYYWPLTVLKSAGLRIEEEEHREALAEGMFALNVGH